MLNAENSFSIYHLGKIFEPMYQKNDPLFMGKIIKMLTYYILVSICKITVIFMQYMF